MGDGAGVELGLVLGWVWSLCHGPLHRQSWGHRRNMRLEDVLDMQELVQTLVITVR